MDNNEKVFEDFETFCDLLDDATDVSTDSWRHGHRETKVLHDTDGDWQVTYDVHHEEGIQWYGPLTGQRVEKHTVTTEVWRLVK